MKNSNSNDDLRDRLKRGVYSFPPVTDFDFKHDVFTIMEIIDDAEGSDKRLLLINARMAYWRLDLGAKKIHQRCQEEYFQEKQEQQQQAQQQQQQPAEEGGVVVKPAVRQEQQPEERQQTQPVVGPEVRPTEEEKSAVKLEQPQISSSVNPGRLSALRIAFAKFRNNTRQKSESLNSHSPSRDLEIDPGTFHPVASGRVETHNPVSTEHEGQPERQGSVPSPRYDLHSGLDHVPGAPREVPVGSVSFSSGSATSPKKIIDEPLDTDTFSIMYVSRTGDCARALYTRHEGDEFKAEDNQKVQEMKAAKSVKSVSVSWKNGGSSGEESTAYHAGLKGFQEALACIPGEQKIKVNFPVDGDKEDFVKGMLQAMENHMKSKNASPDLGVSKNEVKLAFKSRIKHFDKFISSSPRSEELRKMFDESLDNVASAEEVVRNTGDSDNKGPEGDNDLSFPAPE